MVTGRKTQDKVNGGFISKIATHSTDLTEPTFSAASFNSLRWMMTMFVGVVMLGVVVVMVRPGLV